MTNGPRRGRSNSFTQTSSSRRDNSVRTRRLSLLPTQTAASRQRKSLGQITLKTLQSQLSQFKPGFIRDRLIQTLDASSQGGYQRTMAWRGEFGAAIFVNNLSNANAETIAELQQDLAQLKENPALFGDEGTTPLAELYLQVADTVADPATLVESIQATLTDVGRPYTVSDLGNGNFKIRLSDPVVVGPPISSVDKNKQLKGPKLKKVLGVLDVRNQGELGEALDENTLPAFLAGLAQAPVSSLPRFFNSTTTKVLKDAQSAMKQALSRLGKPTTPPWVSESQLRELLSSSVPAKREAGEQVMATLLEVSKYPSIISQGVESGGMAPLIENLQGDRPLDTIQLQTGVIKWMRSRLTTVYFKSALMADLNKAVGSQMPGSAKQDVTSYIANIGFNRLMSGNNLFGASLSSDVDFKLVFDDKQLASDLGVQPQDQDIIAIRKQIENVLKEAQTKFERSFPLTLEVEAFTVKSLSQLEKEASDNEIEKNFLATVLNNQTFMSGNPAVQSKFKAIIQREVGDNIAQRTWTQNLGESDKGSMEIIKALPTFEKALSDIAAAIAEDEDTDLPGLVRQIISPGETVLPNAVLNPIFVQSPEVIKKLLTHDTISSRLSTNSRVVKALESVPMFPSDGSPAQTLKKLKLLSKLMLNFTVNGSRQVVGRPDINPEDDWVYSVKFAGCRLFDMFDQTTLEDYQQGRSQQDTRDPVETYNSGKQVAIAINTFAVQMQNRIYEHYGLGREAGKTHADIDTLYPRLTSAEFSAMLANPSMRTKLNDMMTALLNDLGESPNATEPRLPDSLRQMIEPNLIELSAAVEWIKRGADKAPIRYRPEALGLSLFSALFDIANNTARSMDPRYQA